jgi:peptidyl-prolyl cis-trans isomerase C
MIRYSLLPALLVCALFQLPAPALADPVSNSAALFSDPILATGKGFQIKRSQVDEAFINYSANLAARGRNIPDTDRGLARSNLLQDLIITKILLQKATPDDKLATTQKVDAQIAAGRSNAPSPQAFEESIRARTGMTLEQMRGHAVEEQLCKSILMREVTNGITITPAEIKKFYDDNPTNFDIPDQVRVMHILLLTTDPVTKEPVPAEKKKEKLKLAKELQQRAEKGENFDALAKEYSQDPGVKVNGGEYTFAKNGKMVPEFEAAAFSMKVNQISEPVETQYGYHIIKLLEKIPASRETFTKADPAIRDYLIERAAQKALPAYLDKLKAGADVVILEPEDGHATPAKAAPSPK